MRGEGGGRGERRLVARVEHPGVVERLRRVKLRVQGLGSGVLKCVKCEDRVLDGPTSE